MGLFDKEEPRHERRKDSGEWDRWRGEIDAKHQVTADIVKGQNAKIDNLSTTLSEVVSETKLQRQATETLVNTSIQEIKDCRVSRSWLHKRINKVWTTGVGILVMLLGWLAKEFISKHH